MMCSPSRRCRLLLGLLRGQWTLTALWERFGCFETARE